jgi:hypothetical protein
MYVSALGTFKCQNRVTIQMHSKNSCHVMVQSGYQGYCQIKSINSTMDNEENTEDFFLVKEKTGKSQGRPFATESTQLEENLST